MNVAVTAAKECSSSFFPPALRLVLVFVVCRPSLPLSPSSLSHALFDCCICFCHHCHRGCHPNSTPCCCQAAAAAVLPPSCHRRQAAAAAVPPPSCHRRRSAIAKLLQLPCRQSCRHHAATHSAAHAAMLPTPHCPQATMPSSSYHHSRRHHRHRHCRCAVARPQPPTPPHCRCHQAAATKLLQPPPLPCQAGAAALPLAPPGTPPPPSPPTLTLSNVGVYSRGNRQQEGAAVVNQFVEN